MGLSSTLTVVDTRIHVWVITHKTVHWKSQFYYVFIKNFSNQCNWKINTMMSFMSLFWTPVLLLNDCSVLSKSVYFSKPQFTQWRQECRYHGITRRPHLKKSESACKSTSRILLHKYKGWWLLLARLLSVEQQKESIQPCQQSHPLITQEWLS